MKNATSRYEDEMIPKSRKVVKINMWYRNRSDDLFNVEMNRLQLLKKSESESGSPLNSRRFLAWRTNSWPQAANDEQISPKRMMKTKNGRLSKMVVGRTPLAPMIAYIVIPWYNSESGDSHFWITVTDWQMYIVPKASSIIRNVLKNQTFQLTGVHLKNSGFTSRATLLI